MNILQIIFEVKPQYFGIVRYFLQGDPTIMPHNFGSEWPYRRSTRAFSSIFRKSGLIGVRRAQIRHPNQKGANCPAIVGAPPVMSDNFFIRIIFIRGSKNPFFYRECDQSFKNKGRALLGPSFLVL